MGWSRDGFLEVSYAGSKDLKWILSIYRDCGNNGDIGIVVVVGFEL